MEINLKGRAALITGGSRGIGRGIALALAEAGADVAINYRQDEAAAQETLARIKAMGVKGVALKADISQWAEATRMAEEAVKALGKIDILVNNAGAVPKLNNVVDADPDEVLKVWGTDTLGAFHCCKALIPQMRQQPRGDIIFITSRAVKELEARHASHAIAKVSLQALARTLIDEERPHGIRVNVIAPGLVETQMGRSYVRATRGIRDIKKLYAEAPFGRICQPSDIGYLCAYLVSQQGEYITGQIIYPPGGA